MTLKIKRLDPRAVMPAKAHPTDACFDLAVVMDCDAYALYPFETRVFGTGLAFEVPPGHVMRMYPRSSTGIRLHATFPNCVGIIDSGYRGEVKVALTNLGYQATQIRNGSRVAQFEIAPVLPVEIEEADELSPSDRGENGIGSTGR